VVFGECGREITPGNTGSGRERGGGAARTEQLRASSYSWKEGTLGSYRQNGEALWKV
jgi:hypothetical protein